MKKIKLINRNKGLLSGNSRLEKIHTCKNFPVFFGCTKDDKKTDIHADMHWSIDPQTGIIQLTKLVPLEILYKNAHVDGLGEVWSNYYKNFASYIALRKPKNVLELGGGNGKLAQIVCDQLDNVTWYLVDANPTCEETNRIKVIKGFVDENFKFDVKIDMVVFSQLMEHVYYPEEFISMIRNIIESDAKFVFAYPDLEYMLDKKFTNTLNFEHTMLLTDVHVDYLLTKYGFEIKDKINYNNHSYFYDTEKVGEINYDLKIPNKYIKYKELYQNFLDYHVKLIDELNKKMKICDNPIYLFGAHIFSQYLLFMGLNTKKIITILDNSKTKQGKRLYGTNFIVQSPKILKNIEEAFVIVKTAMYDEEIKKGILDINKNIKFW